MKRILSVLLVLVLAALILSFSGCGTDDAAQPREYDLEAVAAELTASDAFSDILSAVTVETGSKFYGFDTADVKESVMYCSTGATAEEIGLFKCVDEAAAARVLESAQARGTSQKAAYESYAPAEIPKLESAVIKADGLYVFYIVANDYSGVNSLI